MGIALACVAGLLAVMNLVQVVIGRQLVKPSASKRPAQQLRRESGAAALAMTGVVLVALHVIWGVVLVVIGFGWIIVTRKRTASS